MLCEEKIFYAGNLDEEINEIRKIVSDAEGVDAAVTTTILCEAFLTIHCC